MILIKKNCSEMDWRSVVTMSRRIWSPYEVQTKYDNTLMDKIDLWEK